VSFVAVSVVATSVEGGDPPIEGVRRRPGPTVIHDRTKAGWAAARSGPTGPRCRGSGSARVVTDV
jgi:hypothetical protein